MAHKHSWLCLFEGGLESGAVWAQGVGSDDWWKKSNVGRAKHEHVFTTSLLLLLLPESQDISLPGGRFTLRHLHERIIREHLGCFLMSAGQPQANEQLDELHSNVAAAYEAREAELLLVAISRVSA